MIENLISRFNRHSGSCFIRLFSWHSFHLKSKITSSINIQIVHVVEDYVSLDYTKLLFYSRIYEGDLEYT